MREKNTSIIMEEYALHVCVSVQAEICVYGKS